MKFFKNLSAEDFKELMAMLVTMTILLYLFLPIGYTDAAIRGSMLVLLGIIIKHYFVESKKKKDEEDN